MIELVAPEATGLVWPQVHAAGSKGPSGCLCDSKRRLFFFTSLYKLLASYLLFVIPQHRTFKAKTEEQVYFGVPDSVTSE
jgi:hypothetical protein